MRNSVISAPAWPPKPTPPRPMALGGDHAKDEGSTPFREVDDQEGLTSIVQTRNHNSGSTARGEKEACFDDVEDGKAVCAFEDRARNDLMSERLVE